MKKLGLSLSFVLLGIVLNGQGLFNQGYIITLDNDTVYGEIRDEFLRLSGLEPIIKFKQPDNEKVKFSASDIKGYSIINGKSYQCVRTYEGYGFGEIEVDGYYRLVHIEIYGGATWTNTGAGGMIATPNCLYCGYKIFRDSKEVFEVPKKTKYFKEEVSDFFSDYTELQKDIKDKKLRKSDIKLIVEKYNSWKGENFLNFSDGYVIEINNDTVFGEIKYKFKFEHVEQFIKFKSSNGEVVKYKAKEIKGYRPKGQSLA